MRTPSALRRDGLAGVRVGHAASVDGSTGVSVVLFGQAAPTVVDVRGGASGTYDTASLSLDATFGRRWAVFFTGGSVFGLDAGGGVRDAVLGAGGGHAVYRNPNRVAPVSGAVLFDLPARRRRPVDYRTLGHEAAESAVPIAPFAGRVGASSGARIGKYLGRGHSQPGALAIARENDPGFGSVAVLAGTEFRGSGPGPVVGKMDRRRPRCPRSAGPPGPPGPLGSGGNHARRGRHRRRRRTPGPPAGRGVRPGRTRPGGGALPHVDRRRHGLREHGRRTAVPRARPRARRTSGRPARRPCRARHGPRDPRRRAGGQPVQAPLGRRSGVPRRPRIRSVFVTIPASTPRSETRTAGYRVRSPARTSAGQSTSTWG